MRTVQKAEQTVTSADPQTPPGVPSWGPVLATTVRLWAARRLHRLRRSRQALLIAICVLAVGAAVVVVRFSGTSSRPARVPASARAQQSHSPRSGSARSQATSPGGAAYQAMLRSDLADRRSAGAQLMHSRRIELSAQGAVQLQAGEVDSRLLVMLAVLASQHSWRVIAFGDASPGVPTTQAPYRQVIIAAADGPGGTAGLAAALAVLRAQHAPYQPAQVTTVRLAGGLAGLRIDFAAPSPLGLLAGSVAG